MCIAGPGADIIFLFISFSLYLSLYILLLRKKSRRLLRASTTSTDKNETTRMDAMVSMNYSFRCPILQQNLHSPLKNQLTSGKQNCKVKYLQGGPGARFWVSDPPKSVSSKGVRLKA
jgi:hypothetical protein